VYNSINAGDVKWHPDMSQTVYDLMLWVNGIMELECQCNRY